MTSGKKARAKRQQARAAPPPVRRRRGRAQAAPRPGAPPQRAARRASPKVLIGALAGLVVIGAIIGAVVALTGGKSSPKPPTALPGAASVRRMFAGIPQDGNVLGSRGAPVTLVEYIDVQCPYCQIFETKGLPKLLAKYVRPGKLKIEARPITAVGPDSAVGQSALIAAGEQNHLFDVAELLYLNQGQENTGWLTTDTVQRAAASFPTIDYPQFVSALGSPSVSAQATNFQNLASNDAISRTPTFFVARNGETPREVLLHAPDNPVELEQAVRHALRQ